MKNSPKLRKKQKVAAMLWYNQGDAAAKVGAEVVDSGGAPKLDILYPWSSAESGHDLPDLKSTFQMSLCEEPKSSRSVCCLDGSNSHRLQVRC